jgi:hypothetical protein
VDGYFAARTGAAAVELARLHTADVALVDRFLGSEVKVISDLVAHGSLRQGGRVGSGGLHGRRARVSHE